MYILGNVSYHCDVCSKTLSKKRKSESTSTCKYLERRYPCDGCNKTFIKKENLKFHLCVHTGARPYYGDVRSNVFHHKYVINRHLPL